MKNIKKQFLILLFFAAGLMTFAQVGIGTETPEASSVLDITSVEKGFLMPRMNSTQRDDIFEPAAGLQVYDTVEGAIYYYDGANWINSSDSDNLGDHTATEDLNLGANKLVGGGANGIVVDGDGNVGIGEDTPTQKLQVNGNIQTNGSFLASSGNAGTGSMRMSASNGTQSGFLEIFTGSDAVNRAGFLGYTDADKIYYHAENNRDHYFSGDGNFGIGIASPTEKLDVDGKIHSTQQIRSSYGGDNKGFVELATNNNTQSGYVNFGINTDGVESSAGYIGAASPTELTYFAQGMRNHYFTGGTVRIQNYGASADEDYIVTKSEAGVLGASSSKVSDVVNKFVSGSSAVDAVYTAGKVGIGTDSPKTSLHVRKTIRSSYGGDNQGSVELKSNPYSSGLNRSGYVVFLQNDNEVDTQTGIIGNTDANKLVYKTLGGREHSFQGGNLQIDTYATSADADVLVTKNTAGVLGASTVRVSDVSSMREVFSGNLKGGDTETLVLDSGVKYLTIVARTEAGLGKEFQYTYTIYKTNNTSGIDGAAGLSVPASPSLAVVPASGPVLNTQQQSFSVSRITWASGEFEHVDIGYRLYPTDGSAVITYPRNGSTYAYDILKIFAHY